MKLATSTRTFLLALASCTLFVAACGGSSNNGPRTGGVQVTFSGEALGVNGLPFKPVSNGDPVFIDGWNMTFDEILLVVGNVRLAPGATQSPTWSTVGAPVAIKAGPFVLDVHDPKSADGTTLVGKDGTEPAGSIFTWPTLDNGDSFDTVSRYSFSYDVVAATAGATQVNLRADQAADYAMMVSKGWSKLYRGAATYVGTGTYPTAATQAKFAALPTIIHFAFGWNDATNYLGCINPDFGDEKDLANRGIQPTASGNVVAQITLHVDHLFWDVIKQEGAPLRFDPVAAWAPQGTTAANPFWINTIAGKPLATTFSDGTPLPDRGPNQTQLSGTPFTTDQSNPAQVTLGLNGVPSSDIAGMPAFMAFSSQSQMHLNANGLCYTVGQNASDPFYRPMISP